MTLTETLQEAIKKERQQREAFSESDLLPMIKAGKGQEALENLIFFATPAKFFDFLSPLLGKIRDDFESADAFGQERYLRFLAELTLALGSFLPRWNLQNTERHGNDVLADAQLQSAAGKSQAMVVDLAAQAPEVAGKLLAEWRAETVARFKAESADDPEREAADLVGSSLDDYLTNVSAAVAGSNLRRIAEMRNEGQTLTELSNDYAAFLPYVMYLGASFATCNPPLVDVAWVGNPNRWTSVVDGTITDHPEADEDTLARLVTLEVVLDNMHHLRPIFLLTAGQMGCVCFQVNPHKHDDADTMVADARSVYELMKEKLGGVPNVVFKLPGTKAGLEACRALTGQGIGVTITVNFGLFQHVPFAEAIDDGQAIFACLVEMNGRLAYPVRDEMLEKLDELAAYGIDESAAREAAAWAGVAVVKRLHQLLTERGYDLRRVKPLIASLRIYEGNDYARLPSAFPDITEIVGTSLLSVFPNVRRAFDAKPEIDLDPNRIEAPVPAEVLERLAHSEIFKQAYYVANRNWVAEEDERFKPEHELTLDDEASTMAWPPVNATQTEFMNSYDKFVGRISERKRLLSNR